MFENAMMLVGLGGAVVPLVIHLLGRARYRSLEWGAMMFIDAAAAPRFRDPGRLREWTLLGVRMAAVGLLAIALARPVLDTMSASSPGGTEPRIAAAIVVDCSASMGYADVAGERIEQAKRAVLQILSTLKRGDRVALFAAAPAAPPGELTGDLQSIAARTSALKPIAGETDLAVTIESAADLLGRQERVSRQLYVICDRQAANWRSVTDEFADRWRAHAPLARFTVIPVGGSETDNLVVESLAVINPPAVADCPGEVRFAIHNYGDGACAGVGASIRLGTREVFSTTLTVPARSTITTTAAINFVAPPGAQELSAELRDPGGGSGPSLDDRRVGMIDVAPPLRTLLVRSRRDPTTAATDVVRAALAPSTSASVVAAVDVVLISEWDAAKLEDYRVIILDDVVTLDRAQVGALEQFVYAGGGLIIAPGAAARTNDYNRLMYREEGALLPALLQPPLAPPTPLSIDRAGIDASHPLTHFLESQDDQPLAAVSCFIATTARTAEARILGTFSSGDAFLLEAPYGRGRVVLMTCSLRSDWSTLPLTPLYLPLLQSMVRYAGGAEVRDRNFATGTEIVARFEPEVSATRGTVIRPDGSTDRCEIISAEGRSEARYASTDLAGVYTIRTGPRPADPSVKFSLAPPPPRESDLTPMDDAAWARMQDQLGFTRMEPTDRTLAARLIGTRDSGAGERVWLIAVAAVLGLFIIELALMRAWSAPTTAKGALR